jgi:hypothetical protein
MANKIEALLKGVCVRMKVTVNYDEATIPKGAKGVVRGVVKKGLIVDFGKKYGGASLVYPNEIRIC